MKPTLLLVSLSLALVAGCSHKSSEPPPTYCVPPMECPSKPDGLFVQVHAGDRDCDATLAGPDVVVASGHCLRGASLADVTVEVEGEVLSAREVSGDLDALRIRVAHEFAAADRE
jgi:hypothetical protein